MDFWYSAEMEAHLKENKRFDRWGNEKYVVTKFKNQVFTEQIKHGKKPLSYRWGDLVFIGTGTSDDCHYS